MFSKTIPYFVPAWFKFWLSWHRLADLCTPFEEGVEKGERKLRRSCAHPRAGASRHRARLVYVSDWPAVQSRAFRSSSLFSSPSDTNIVAPPSSTAPPVHCLFHLLITLRSDLDTYLVEFKFVDRRESRTTSIGWRCLRSAEGKSQRARNATRDDFPQRERLIPRERISLGREGDELLSDRVFPLLASHSFYLPFSRRWLTLLCLHRVFLSVLSCFPTLRYISTNARLFLPNRLVPVNSHPGPSRTFTSVYALPAHSLVSAVQGSTWETRLHLHISKEGNNKAREGREEEGERGRGGGWGRE